MKDFVITDKYGDTLSLTNSVTDGGDSSPFFLKVEEGSDIRSVYLTQEDALRLAENLLKRSRKCATPRHLGIGARPVLLR